MKKTITLVCLILSFPLIINTQNVGIGTVPDPSAQLDVSSTSAGLLPPRMTEVQRNAIANPAAGLIIYCTDCRLGGDIQFYNGFSWSKMSGELVPASKLGDDIDGESNGNQSGYATSLSADGTRVAIGAYLNSGSASASGHVRVYEWNGTSWNQLGADIDGEAAGDNSGRTLSISPDGTRVAIGGPQNDGNGSASGHVRVYEWNQVIGVWDQMGSDIDGENPGDNSGFNLALSSDGTTIIIGAPYNDDTDTNAGYARIFEWNGASWIQVGDAILGEAAGDFFGWSVSISSDGSTVAIGGHQNDGNGSNSGHVRIYKWINSSWILIAPEIEGEAAEDQSGHSVSISSNGTIVAIGANQNDGNGSGSGHVRVYENN